MNTSNHQTSAVQVRTREAPSPTGSPHVGTALQALFNWVYARKHHGQFILRIEDTDQKRFVPGAEEEIFEALDWLNLAADESIREGGPYGPYRQSERLEIYQEYAGQLVKNNQAYHCFCSPERLEQVRQQQQQQKLPPKYDRHCAKLTSEEVKQRLEKGEKAVIRLKIPNNRKIVVHDELRGEVVFDSKDVGDQVLMKSDGFPTYHLAVVVDDHLMKISHMKRGEEWLPSAPKHVLLYEFFGWQIPVMIHMPTLRNPDRSKLSKRKGNTSLWWYRAQGFLPSALLNFLALLVWKPEDEREIFSRQDMIDEFDWDQIQVTGPIFDVKKLSWINGQYIRQMSHQDLLKEVNDWASWVSLRESEPEISLNAQKLISWQKTSPEVFSQAVGLAQSRLKTLSELPSLISFYFETELQYDLADLLQQQPPQAITQMLQKVVQTLETKSEWPAEMWDQTIRHIADEFNVKHKVLFMSLRSALTAREATPPILEMMEIMGHANSLDRIKNAVDFINHSS